MSKVGIFVGSVYGNAQHVAEDVNTMLSAQGLVSEVFTDPSLNDFKQVSSMLFISSTTGQGDIPPNLEFFVQDLREQFPLMEQKPFAVAGLGDSSYGETYCGQAGCVLVVANASSPGRTLDRGQGHREGDSWRRGVPAVPK